MAPDVLPLQVSKVRAVAVRCASTRRSMSSTTALLTAVTAALLVGFKQGELFTFTSHQRRPRTSRGETGHPSEHPTQRAESNCRRWHDASLPCDREGRPLQCTSPRVSAFPPRVAPRALFGRLRGRARGVCGSRTGQGKFANLCIPRLARWEAWCLAAAGRGW